jgi:DNA-binding response OmpR family regulator
MRSLLLTQLKSDTRAIQKALEAEQFAVDLPAGDVEPLELVTEINYDVVVLDLTPANAGLITAMRAEGVTTPILALHTPASRMDRLKALELGADDCLSRPFSLRELVVRVGVLLRRPTILIHKLRVGDLELDSTRHTAVRQGKSIKLTPKEFSILEYLMRNAGCPVTRSSLIEHVWNGQFEGLTNVVDVYINFLRRKVDHNFESKLIRTAYGIGYMVDEGKSEVHETERPAA